MNIAMTKQPALQEVLPNAPSDPAPEAEFAYSGMELDAMAGAVHYYGWIIRHFAPYVGNEVLEVGAGVGTFTSHLMAALPEASRNFTLIEPAANLYPVLERRFRGHSAVATHQGDLLACAPALRSGASRPDTAILVNVLEHVEDDAGCLALLHEILQPGGHLLVFVPALPALYGSLDSAFEHYRRFTHAELQRKLRDAGFDIRRTRFFNLPGVAAWWFSGKIMRRRTLSPAAVRFYDRWVVRPWSRVEDVWPPPLGQNLMAIAQKPAV